MCAPLMIRHTSKRKCNSSHTVCSKSGVMDASVNFVLESSKLSSLATVVHDLLSEQISADYDGKIFSTRSTFSTETLGLTGILPLQRHPVVSNCRYHRRMFLSHGGSH